MQLSSVPWEAFAVPNDPLSRWSVLGYASGRGKPIVCEHIRTAGEANVLAAAPDLLAAIQTLGAMPEGYCFCSENRIGDASKIHEPECRDVRRALAKAEGYDV